MKMLLISWWHTVTSDWLITSGFLLWRNTDAISHHLKGSWSSRTHTATGTSPWVMILLRSVSDCLASNKGRVELKRTHSYYYHVQMAKFCTKKEWCDFLLRTTIDYHCERVQFDESFCGVILPTLRRFYILVILPWRPSQSESQRTGLPRKTVFFRWWKGLSLEETHAHNIILIHTFYM